MAAVVPSLPLYIQLGAVLHGDKVRKKLDEVADRFAARCVELDGDEGDDIGREDGTRPGDHSIQGMARPYARITASAEQEFGSAAVVRKRLLGQTAAEFNSGVDSTGGSG